MSRYFHFGRLCLFLFLLSMVMSVRWVVPAVQAQDAAALTPYDTTRILTLPFIDPRVRVQAGWSEHMANPRNANLPNRRTVSGVDFVFGALDNSNTWWQFDIVAAADGIAQANCGAGIGQFVKIDHTALVNGQQRTFRTYYGHLETIAADIPDCRRGGGAVSEFEVTRGQFIGTAGATGADKSTWIHLHFSVFDTSRHGVNFDPYELYAIRNAYYPMLQFAPLGELTYFRDDPPQYPPQSQPWLEFEGLGLNAGMHDAPSKIETTLIAPTGSSPDDISVRVGQADAAIVALMPRDVGTYLLQFVPPPQSAPGSYDLHIQVADREINLPRAVSYTRGLTTDVDVMLIIDRSGSMQGDRIVDARNAARQFVAFMRDSDRLGLVAFDFNASLLFNLSPLNAANRQRLGTTIDRIGANGGTSIGAGLLAAARELRNRQTVGRQPSIILLSDGDENQSPWVRDVLPSIGNITVHTISLGEQANQVLMQQIAAQTGGRFFHAPTSDQLRIIYETIRALVAREQTMIAEVGVIAAGQETEHRLHVDGLTDELLLSVTWGGSDLDLSLRAPDGSIIDASAISRIPDASFISTPTFEYYRLRNPQPGEWVLHVRGVVAEVGGEAYTVRATGQSDLTMTTFLDRPAYLLADPAVISAALFDLAPLEAAQVSATVRTPSGRVITLPLVDDGQSRDSAANDGHYAALLRDTLEVGVYTLDVLAQGESDISGSWQRSDSRSFFVQRSTTPRSDLSIEVNAPVQIGEGETFEYAVNYANLGPDASAATRLVVLLPEGLRLDDAANLPDLNPAPDVAVYELGALAVDSEGSLTLRANAETRPANGRAITQFGISTVDSQVDTETDFPGISDPDMANNVIDRETQVNIGLRSLLPVIGIVLLVAVLIVGGYFIWQRRRHGA